MAFNRPSGYTFLTFSYFYCLCLHISGQKAQFGLFIDTSEATGCCKYVKVTECTAAKAAGQSVLILFPGCVCNFTYFSGNEKKAPSRCVLSLPLQGETLLAVN